MTTLDDIKSRLIYLNNGRPISFIDGEKKTKALAWMLERYFRLKTEGVEVPQRGGITAHYQCFLPDHPAPQLTREQLAAIEFAARHCNECTLGLWRDEIVRLPYEVGAPLCEEDGRTQVWTFTDHERALMCLSVCRDVFGLNAELRSFPGEWMVEVTANPEGGHSLNMADYFRLQGAARLLAEHTIAPAPKAVEKGVAFGIAGLPTRTEKAAAMPRRAIAKAGNGCGVVRRARTAAVAG